jgi:hypothetical protein
VQDDTKDPSRKNGFEHLKESAIFTLPRKIGEQDANLFDCFKRTKPGGISCLVFSFTNIKN